MRSLCVGVLFSLVAIAPGRAEPLLADLRVAVVSGSIQISFELRGAYSKETFERIHTGLPTGFEYQFRLDRDRKRWFDASLATATLQVVAMYNAVTDEYLVNSKLDGDLIESKIVRDPAALEMALTRFEGIEIFPSGAISTDDRVLVRVRADLGAKSGFLFLPTRETTGWERSRKFRRSDEAG
jgi:hypothetical protein